MEFLILAVVLILYHANFYLLAHEYLKVPAAREFRVNLSGRMNMAEFIRSLDSLHMQKAKEDKVNWKEEGF